MSTELLYSLAGVALFCIGVHGLVVREHLLRKLMALNIMGSAVFLFLVTVAYRNRDPLAGSVPDAVPHAMVLTGIVVAVSATAFALALARRIHALTGRATLGDEDLGDEDLGDEDLGDEDDGR